MDMNRPHRDLNSAKQAAAPGASPAARARGRILRNSLLNILGQACLAAFQLIVVFVLARGLGKEGLGQYFTIFALVLVVQMVVETGLGTVLTCRIAQAPERWKEIVAEGAGLFAIVFAVSALAMLSIGAAWAWSADNAAILLPFAAAAVACAFIQVQRFCAGVFRAFELVGYENLGRALQGFTFAGLVIGAALLGWANIASVLAMFATSHIVTSLYLLMNLQRRFHCLAWRLSVAQMRDWLTEAVPLGLGDVVRRITWQLGTILLALLQPAAVVGIYSVACRPLGPLNWLPNAVLAATFPSFARMAADTDTRNLQRAFSNSIRLMWIVSLPLTVTICLCAEPLILLLAGAEFLEAAVPLRFLIWISTLSFLSVQYRFIFTAVGKQHIYSRLVVLVFLLELGLQLALIPALSYFGACAGSMVGEFFFTAFGLYLCQRMGVGKIEWRAMAAATLSGGAMAGVLWCGLGSSVPLLAMWVVLATATYVGLCVLLGAVHRSEMRHFGHTLANLFRRKPAGAAEASSPAALELSAGTSQAVGTRA